MSSLNSLYRLSRALPREMACRFLQRRDCDRKPVLLISLLFQESLLFSSLLVSSLLVSSLLFSSLLLLWLITKLRLRFFCLCSNMMYVWWMMIIIGQSIISQSILIYIRYPLYDLLALFALYGTHSLLFLLREKSKRDKEKERKSDWHWRERETPYSLLLTGNWLLSLVIHYWWWCTLIRLIF